MSIFNFRMLSSQSQQPRLGFMLIEVLFALMLLGAGVYAWAAFYGAMLDRMAIAQERALGYAYARSCLSRFTIEGASSFSEGGFKVTIERQLRLGRFCKVALRVEGKRDTFYVYTGIYQ